MLNAAAVAKIGAREMVKVVWSASADTEVRALLMKKNVQVKMNPKTPLAAYVTKGGAKKLGLKLAA